MCWIVLVFSANSRFSTILNLCIPCVSFAENGIDPDPRAQEMMLEQYRTQGVPWPIGSMVLVYMLTLGDIGGILMVNVT